MMAFSKSRGIRLCDVLFLAAALVLTLAAVHGNIELSGHGAVLDSDLSVYTASMVGREHRELFPNDPVLHNATSHNSFVNASSVLAKHFLEGVGYADAMLKGGGITIFLFFALWYLLGRYLFGSPTLAILLALVEGITCWVGYGTFWGITHSDPTPRAFYAAIWPLFLMGAMMAVRQPLLKPLVMFAAGLSMWCHGISALATGAMLFVAFALVKSPDIAFKRHVGLCLGGLVAFLVPVLVFLAGSTASRVPMTADELAVMRELMQVRYEDDYGAIWPELAHYLGEYTIRFPLFPLALMGIWLVRKRGNERLRALTAMFGPFVLGMAAVFLFSVFEGRLAGEMGRLPLGHELVRGVRFLIPLAWLGLVGGIACLVRERRIAQRLLVVAVTILLLFGSNDRQFLNALHTLRLDRLSPHREEIAQYARNGEIRAEVFRTFKELTTPRDLVACSRSEPAIRYMSLRQLVHAHKDGANIFYDRDPDAARQWLRHNAMMEASPVGYVDVWLDSGARWLLSDRPEDRELLTAHGDIVWEKNGWLIVRRREGSPTTGPDDRLGGERRPQPRHRSFPQLWSPSPGGSRMLARDDPAFGGARRCATLPSAWTRS